MNKILNYKNLAIAQILIAGLTFLAITDGANLINGQRLLVAAIGLAGGVFLLKENTKKGLMLSIIWAVLQIPIYVSGNEDGSVFVFNTHQSIHFYYYYTQRGLSGLGNWFMTFGINFVGVLWLGLLWSCKPKKI